MLNTRSVDKNIDELETRKSKHQKPDGPEFPYAVKELMKNKVLIKASESFKGKIFHTPKMGHLFFVMGMVLDPESNPWSHSHA